MKSILKRFWGLVALVVIFLFGAVAGNGFIERARETVYSVKVECRGNCAKPFFIAEIDLLRCQYMRLLQPEGVMFVAIENWRGDVDIPAEKTANKKPFPPPHPYVTLTKEEAKHVRDNDKRFGCPYLLNESDRVAWRKFEVEAGKLQEPTEEFWLRKEDELSAAAKAKGDGR